MMNIIRGQRIKLNDLGLSNHSFSIHIEPAKKELSLDISCFGLDINKQLTDDRYMIFFNQPTSPCGAVSVIKGTQFNIDLLKLPDTIHSLIFTISIEGSGVMNQLGDSLVRITQDSKDLASHQFTGHHFANERAIMLIELYRKDTQWRLNMIGQGFNGGLDALVTHFGGEVAQTSMTNQSKSNKAPKITEADHAHNTTNHSLPEPTKSKVSLSKVTLQKSGDKVSLTKNTDAKGFGKMRVNLKWNTASAEKSFFGKPKKIDLDLGCMFELNDGQVGVVQALGDAWGDINHAPFIQLDSDDRSGHSSAGENLWINGDYFSQIKRIVLYTFIYEGATDWRTTNGVVLIEMPDQPPIEVQLDGSDNRPMCAIAVIENINQNLCVTKLVEYFKGHREVSHQYHFGLQFRSGSK